MNRRTFLGSLGLGAAGALAVLHPTIAAQGPAQQAKPKPPAPPAQPALPAMTVYKSATCGCCTSWVEHARGAGFTVRTIDTEDLAGVKAQMGVPQRLQSCHTVVVGSYLVEGHVPASDVKRMLAEKPAIRGIAVPGMPVGSPGMEQGSRKDPYQVMAFTTAGVVTVYAQH